MLDRFFAKIEETKASLGFRPGEECFYRGQGNTTWPLLPSLFRHCREKQVTGVSLRQLEATLFYEFQARARELHGRNLSGWDILFFMRHHGVATRLLDWTEILGVALYFAVQGSGGGTPCVWVLNPYALNDQEKCWKYRDLVAPQYLADQHGEVRDYDWFLHGGFPPFGWEHPVALYPLRLSDRLHAQGGYFTIHGVEMDALESIGSSVLQRVDIETTELVDEIKRYLQTAGINTNLLFPDLDGLARHVHEKYGIFQTPEVGIYGK